MTPSSATTCARCGALLPFAAAGSVCPACGQPLDPHATWRPAAGSVPPIAVVELPPRLPLAGLALVGVICALMGLGLGMWLGWGRNVPVRRAAAPLPALPLPGPPIARPLPAPRFYPAPAPAAAPLSLPPARVTPPALGGGEGALLPSSARRFAPVFSRPLAPSPARPLAPSPPLPLGPEAPLKAEGMATVRVQNPSAAVVGVTLSGRGGPIGVVGPHASIDFLLPPGRYDIALHGPTRIQRIYDAPLHSGDLLALVYSAPPEDRPGSPAP